jgi:GT2 family glycosyltransferase
VIPVFIAPVISRFDLLGRMLASVDVPVERGIIVDNSCTGYAAREPWRVLVPPYGGMGYTGGINAGIAQTPEAPWWMWASNDVLFGPGDLAAIAQLMAEAEGARLVTHGFTWGAINRACVETVGLFDEWSFWPIYFDDTDYLNRCILGGVDWIVYEGGIRHGADGHANSVTIKSDVRHEDANNRSWALNRQAYIEKWGGPPGKETFSSPWNSGLPLWAVRPDPAGRAARVWA